MKKIKNRRKFKVAASVIIALILAVIALNFNNIREIILLYQDANTKVQSIDDRTFDSVQTSYIFDNKNNLISKLYDSKDIEYITYNKLPQEAVQSFVAIEDKDFYNHHGISIKGIVRAAYSMMINKGEITQGGSTITQQLAKNIFLTQEQSMSRKIEEAFIALKLEKLYTKEQIFEFYVNNIYFGNNAYGIEAASKKYFDKDINSLDLSQIAFLAAIPNNPTYYDPLKNEDNTLQRRNLILQDMKAQGFITQDQYDNAVSEDIVLNPEKNYRAQSYVNSYVLDCAAKALMEQKGFVFQNTFTSTKDKEVYNEKYSSLYTECTNELYRNGYKIYTSIDQDKQKLLQQTVDKELSPFTEKSNGIYALQGAAVSIDNKTGTIVAIVGGRTSDKQDYLNRAFQSFRQPGSSLKPLVVYTPAFEKGYSPSSVIDDKYIDGGPHNDDNTYSGNVTLRYATQLSLNTVAYQLFQQITPKYGLSFLNAMNFSKIDDRDYALSAALGGLTNGASPVEMASAYSTLSRGGEFINPSCILSITDSFGNVIYKNKMVEKRVYSEDSSYLMTDVLKGNMDNSWGTGYNVRLTDMTSAGKTGTTDKSKDGWFCGYTPYFTTVVWVGYDKPKTLDNLYGATYPGNIWHNYMEIINQGLVQTDFSRPNTIEDIYVDKATGEQVPSDYPDAIKEVASANNLPQSKDLSTNEDSIENIAQSVVADYENCKLDTPSDVQHAEQLETSAMNRVDQIQSSDVKNQLLKRLLTRKVVVDEKIKELSVPASQDNSSSLTNTTEDSTQNSASDKNLTNNNSNIR